MLGMSVHEVLEGPAVQLEPADAFTGLLVDVQTHVLGKLVRACAVRCATRRCWRRTTYAV
jgi:hypothetical protein